MVERGQFRAIGSAELDQKPATKPENSRLSRFKIPAKILGPALVIAAIVSACEGNSQPNNPFGFDIPSSIETTEEALAFVRGQEAAKGVGQILINNEEIEITSFVGGIPELERFYDMGVKIKKDSVTAEEASQIQSEWEGYFEDLFDPIGVCGTTETVDYNDPKRDVAIDWIAFVGPQNEETHLNPCP